MKAELIIPNLDNDGTDNSAVIETAIKELCALYGGCTAFPAEGFWVNDAGKLYADKVTVLVSAALNSSKEAELRDLARSVLDATDQEAVFMSIGGKAEIVE